MCVCVCVGGLPYFSILECDISLNGKDNVESPPPKKKKEKEKEKKKKHRGTIPSMNIFFAMQRGSI